jgi:hypothetical protein
MPSRRQLTANRAPGLHEYHSTFSCFELSIHQKTARSGAGARLIALKASKSNKQKYSSNRLEMANLCLNPGYLTSVTGIVESMGIFRKILSVLHDSCCRQGAQLAGPINARPPTFGRRVACPAVSYLRDGATYPHWAETISSRRVGPTMV